MFWSLRKPMMGTVYYFESKFFFQSSKGMTFSKQTACPLSEVFASHLSMLLVLSFNYKSISFFRGSSWPRDQTCVSCVPALAGRFFTTVPSESQVHLSSVAQSHWTLCDPMDCSTPGLPVHHQLLEFTQTHVHWVGDTSHPLLSPSPPALNLSQHQGHFKWISSSHQVAKVLELQLQYQSFQWIFRVIFL